MQGIFQQRMRADRPFKCTRTDGLSLRRLRKPELRRQLRAPTSPKLGEDGAEVRRSVPVQHCTRFRCRPGTTAIVVTSIFLV